jgi:hypothetical protein
MVNGTPAARMSGSVSRYGAARQRRCGVRVPQAGVGQQSDASPLDRVDDRGVLGDRSLRVVAGDQQDPVGAFDRGVKGVRLVVIGPPDLDSAFGEIRRLARVADRGRNLGCGHPQQQALDHQTTQFSGSSSDDDHDVLFRWTQSLPFRGNR